MNRFSNRVTIGFWIILVITPSLWAQDTERSPISQVITAELRDEYRLDDDFTNNERRLLRRALEIVYERFLADKVWNNFTSETRARERTLSRAGIYFDKDAIGKQGQIDRKLLTPHHISPRQPNNHDLVFRAQFNRLRWHVLEQQQAKFPAIVLSAVSASPNSDKFDIWKQKAHAWAEVGTVTVSPETSNAKELIRGEFEISINTHKLRNANSRQFRDPYFWAGTIAHEMLHGLGHRHPSAGTEGYWLYEINIFPLCLLTNGEYKWEDQYHSTITCGCMNPPEDRLLFLKEPTRSNQPDH